MIVFAGRRGVPGNPGVLWIGSYPQARVARLIMLEKWGGPQELRSIVTDFQLEVGGNQQILHTLGQKIFVYNFGDRAGTVRVAGLAFPELCPADKQPEKTGIELLYDYYFRNRLTKRRAPLVLHLGLKTAFKILLHDLQISSVGQDDICRFILHATILPPESNDP